MLFEWIEFLGWGWLIAAHIAAFGLLFLPIIVSAIIGAVDRAKAAATPAAKPSDPSDAP